MSNYIDNFADSVRHILGRDPWQANDFVSLAIAGEQLRRACEVEVPGKSASESLRSYDEFLTSYQGPLPDGLEETIADELSELVEYSQVSRAERDAAKGEALLLGLDESLSVVAAMVRAKQFTSDRALALAAPVSERVGALAVQCAELAQFAEDRELLFGSDPMLPDLYAWWEELAELAPSRLRLHNLVTASARRERLHSRALAVFDAKHAPSAVASLVGRLKQAMSRLVSRELVVSAQALQGSYSDGANVPGSQEAIFEDESFSVFRAGKHLVFKTSKEHRLDGLVVRVGDQLLSSERLDETCLRVELPVTSGRLDATVEIDGEELRLPAIEFKSGS